MDDEAGAGFEACNEENQRSIRGKVYDSTQVTSKSKRIFSRIREIFFKPGGKATTESVACAICFILSSTRSLTSAALM